MVWYVRRGDGPRIRIKAEFGTSEFQAQYESAAQGKPIISSASKAKTGSFQWLWDRYRETQAWASLSSATRRQRENITARVMETSGKEPYGAITEAHIESGKDRRRETPAQARNFLDAMRGLFRWARKSGHIAVDPTANVENPPKPKGEGFPPWNEDDVAAYEAKWGPGTKERVWLYVLLYTGLRRGDAVRAGRQHIKDGVLSLKTEKSGFTVPVTLRILPPLAAVLEHSAAGDMPLIRGDRGRRMTKESFGNAFSAAALKAGIRKSAHGIRKLAATIMADNGATEAELEAVFGWRGGAMASHYTREANRKRLALGAMDKLTRYGDGSKLPL